MFIRRLLAIATGIPVLILLLSLQTPVRAQQSPCGWTPPINISNAPAGSTLPLIVADPAGVVHVIWSESSQNSERDGFAMLYYRRLMDGSWSDANDVLGAVDGASPHALAVDRRNRLALLWNQVNRLNISFADTADARSAQAWSTTVLESDGLVQSADLAIDRAGRYHVVYVRNAKDLVYTFADDSANGWSIPVVVTSNTARSAFGLVSIAVDMEGRVFVAWTRHAEETNWGPAGVWFSRSSEEGQNWTIAEEIVPGQGYGASELFVDAADKLHLVWIGSLAVGGRYHRWSTDSGDHWSDILTVVQASGYAGPPVLLQDSSGTIHLVSAGIGLGRPSSIWYSRLLAGAWQPALAISGSSPDSEGPHATVSLGHVIHAVWIEYGTGDIWYSACDTGAPATSLEVMYKAASADPLPTVNAAESQPTDASYILAPIPSPTTEVTVPISVPANAMTTASSSALLRPTAMSTTVTLIIGILPALIVVGGTVLFVSTRRRTR